MDKTLILKTLDKYLFRISNLITTQENERFGENWCPKLSYYNFYYSWLDKYGIEKIKDIINYSKPISSAQCDIINYYLYCINQYDNIWTENIHDYLESVIEQTAEFIENVHKVLS